VAAGLLTFTFMTVMLSEHPIAALTVLAVAAVVTGAGFAGRERTRRQTLGSRADYGHRALMAASMPSLLAPRQPLSPASYPQLTEVPTDRPQPRWRA
jgi:hypothetical protein